MIVGIIYGLTDRRIGEIRYVGKTTMSVQQRLLGHLKDARKFTGTHKRHWIHSIGLDNVGITVLETTTLDKLDDAEIRWIAELRKSCSLTNMNDGGTGGPPSEETREKIRASKLGIPLTEEHRQKLRVARKGKKPSLGKTWSLTKETRQNQSEAAKRRWTDPGYRAAQREARS
jgi:hypothetical protein